MMSKSARCVRLSSFSSFFATSRRRSCPDKQHQLCTRAHIANTSLLMLSQQQQQQQQLCTRAHTAIISMLALPVHLWQQQQHDNQQQLCTFKLPPDLTEA